MARTAARREQTPFPTTQSAELKQPTISENDHTAARQQHAPPAATEKVEMKQPTITENGVRLRAYERYLERGAIPGDEIRDWLQAGREFLED
jgi:hypothetical protein